MQKLGLKDGWNELYFKNRSAWPTGNKIYNLNLKNLTL